MHTPRRAKRGFTLAEGAAHVDMPPRHAKFGFTLAEVLITLGIIGVVAAMTIPNLMQKYQEHVTVTKVKKMYSVLSQAYKMNKAQDEVAMGNTQDSGDVGATEVAAIFMPYLKVARDCGTTKRGCMYDGVFKTLYGVGKAKYDVGGIAAYRVLLNDGSSIWFRRDTGFFSVIFYDVNGPKPPNRYGFDVFLFIVDDENEKIEPSGVSGYIERCLNGNLGFYCTGYIIRHGNMDYIKKINTGN